MGEVLDWLRGAATWRDPGAAARAALCALGALWWVWLGRGTRVALLLWCALVLSVGAAGGPGLPRIFARLPGSLFLDFLLLYIAAVHPLVLTLATWPREGGGGDGRDARGGEGVTAR